MPSANYRDPEGFVSLTLDEGRGRRHRPHRAARVPHRHGLPSLSGVANLTSPRRQAVNRGAPGRAGGCVPPDQRLAAPGRANLDDVPEPVKELHQELLPMNQLPNADNPGGRVV